MSYILDHALVSGLVSFKWFFVVDDIVEIGEINFSFSQIDVIIV